MRDPRRSRRPDAEALAALASLYAEVDAAFAGWSCPASTECCRFGVTGREPYVTSIELAAVRRAVADNGGERALLSRTTLGGSAQRLPMVDDELRCPLLDARGRCTVYEARPLGCRTYFRDRASPGAVVRRAEIARFVRAVQAIAAAHETDGDRGRPLTRAFAPRP